MSQNPATILVIDDEVQIRKFLRISLTAQGHKVLEGATGQEGLAQAALGKPDLVVLDLGLPDMDGQQVLRELRVWSQVPVLVLSVRASEGEKVLALDGGANDYVTKPFGIQEFLARVRVLLRLAGGAEHASAAVSSGQQRPATGGLCLPPSQPRWRRGQPDAKGIRGTGATGAAYRSRGNPTATAQGHLGAEPYRGQPLSACCSGASAAEAWRRPNGAALYRHRSGCWLSPARGIVNGHSHSGVALDGLLEPA